MRLSEQDDFEFPDDKEYPFEEATSFKDFLRLLVSENMSSWSTLAAHRGTIFVEAVIAVATQDILEAHEDRTDEFLGNILKRDNLKRQVKKLIPDSLFQEIVQEGVISGLSEAGAIGDKSANRLRSFYKNPRIR